MKRRQFFLLLGAAVGGSLLSGCKPKNGTSHAESRSSQTSEKRAIKPNSRTVAGTDSDFSDNSSNQQEIQMNSGKNPSQNSGKSLVIYFSHSGNTRSLAQQIQKATGATIFEAKPIDAYPTDYDTVVKQAKKEIEADYRPALAATLENLAQYDTIYIGSPCWWGTIAPPLATLLTQNNFSGKTLRPFMTHEGSGMGRSVADIKKLAPTANVLAGLPVWGHSVQSATADINRWL